MSEIDEIRNNIKYKKLKNFDIKRTSFGLINKFLFVVLITLITLILLKGNSNFKEKFYKYVYENNISFPQINSLYQKYFGKPIPDIKEETKATFDEKLTFESKTKYKDGVELVVNSNYIVPAINSGMVIFIGKKDDYGNTVVIEQTDGTEVWYSNITTNLKMYDYVEKGNSIGEADKKLYLVFKKDGNILNYEDYI